MPTLFQLPKQVLRDETGTAYPNAQAYFYLTGTSTPADVYEDSALATAFTQPVTADASGVFAPIYIDPSVLIDVSVYDQNSVLLYGPIAIPQGPTTLAATTSLIAADRSVLTTEYGYLFLVNGTYTVTLPTGASAGDGWSVLVRNIGSGIVTVQSTETINSSSGSITLGRDTTAILTYNGGSGDWFASIMGYEMGSFTATQTGYAASLTPTVYWMKQGTEVTIFFPSASTGTSNAATMTIQLPVAVTPAHTSVVQCLVTDNGTQQTGLVSVDTSAVATFGKAVTGTGGFTTSGTKGFAAGTQFRYSLG